jgi:hypothetical protein
MSDKCGKIEAFLQMSGYAYLSGFNLILAMDGFLKRLADGRSKFLNT